MYSAIIFLMFMLFMYLFILGWKSWFWDNNDIILSTRSSFARRFSVASDWATPSVK